MVDRYFEIPVKEKNEMKRVARRDGAYDCFVVDVGRCRVQINTRRDMPELRRTIHNSSPFNG
jgi:hypothetical protein